MKYILTIVTVAVFFLLGAFLYIWLGYYNIAATEPHFGITLSLIEMLRDRSIEVRSDDIKVPALDDEELKEHAVIHYHEMCRLCHGAPGYPPEEFAEGLYPMAPVLTSGTIQEEINNKEIYWILKNGIKMTGMPAFGPTHRDGILWGLVALARDIPKMEPEQYNQMVENAARKGEAGHRHMNEDPEEVHGNSHGMGDDMEKLTEMHGEL